MPTTTTDIKFLFQLTTTDLLIGLIGRCGDDAIDGVTARITLVDHDSATQRTEVLYEGVQIGWYYKMDDDYYAGLYVRLGKGARSVKPCTTAEDVVLEIMHRFGR